jgi:hypothetical protein
MMPLAGDVMVMANTRNRRAREQQVRRLAQQQGLRLEKSRIRTPQARGYGGYRLWTAEHTAVVYGGIPYQYGATLDEIERFLRDLPPLPMPEECWCAGLA